MSDHQPTGLRLESASATHAGTVRKLNEDSLLDRPEIGLWAVADGVGGADAGDYASQLVVRLLGEVNANATAAGLLADVKEKLTVGNENLRAAAVNLGASTIATTVVVLIAYGEYYAAVWVGDSRLYRLRDGLSQITKDHSHVQEMVDAGILTEEEARGHPQANVITRAVGVDGDMRLDVIQDRLQAGDIFLLCSDGLTKSIPDAEIAEILLTTTLASTPQRLIDLALARGASDNVTVVVVECLPGE